MSNEPNQPRIDELATQYVDDNDRFVVALIVSYDEDDAATPELAAGAALSLTRDLGSLDTLWSVHDRQTGETHLIEQADFEDLEIP